MRDMRGPAHDHRRGKAGAVGDAVQRLAEHAVLADQRLKLLGRVARRRGPEPRARTAGQDYGDDRRHDLTLLSRERVRSASTTGRGRSAPARSFRSEEHTSELQSLMRISYAVFCLKKKKKKRTTYENS